jgi:hypothetical protein
MATFQDALAAKAAALDNYTPNLKPELTLYTPAESHPFVNNGSFVNYPAPGAGTTQLLSYQVPPGSIAVIKALSIVAIGGGFIDGSGNVIWRCWLNGAGIDGLQQLTAHVGNFDSPIDMQLVLDENDLFYITVEVPSTGSPQPGTTGARIQGWSYSKAQAQAEGIQL